jgi:hypothetical protein
MNLLMTRWTSLLALSSMVIACSDAVQPPVDASTSDTVTADIGRTDTGTPDAGTPIDRPTVDVPSTDVGTDVPGDIANDRGADGGSSCATAVEGAACSMEGQSCGGPCSDPCQFCNIFRCSSGRWTRLEIFPMPCNDGGSADVASASGARMLWQAPGGFAGTGPAVMVDADGTVRVWDNTHGVDLASPSTPTRTLHVTEAAVRDLFARWSMVDRSGLPHSGSAGECSGSAEYRACGDASCRVERVMFTNAAQLAPEMDPVRMWFDVALAGETSSAHPASYCRF